MVRRGGFGGKAEGVRVSFSGDGGFEVWVVRERLTVELVW